MSAAIPMSEFQESNEPVTIEHIPLERIEENKANPRKVFKGMDELVESVRTRGVLQPILARPKGGGYELVFGARRFRAAKAAGLETIPAMVRELGDPEALEIMIIENAKREDVHPLEEAQGYQELHVKFKQDVATIAAKVGRSVAYVYDRMKLLSLTPKNQERFLADEFTAGHAIILARLDAETQEDGYRVLFDHEQLGLGVTAKHPRSVRWLANWADQNSRIDLDDEDTNLMLFPEMVEVVKRATEEAAKVVHITRSYSVAPEHKDGEKILGPNSWRDARQEECPHSVTGVVVIGEGRGTAIPVCLHKKDCRTHWADAIKEAKKREKERAASADGTSKPAKKKEESWQERSAREQAEREAINARYTKAAKNIDGAIRKAVEAASVKGDGELVKIIAEHFRAEMPEKDASPVEIIRHFASEAIADLGHNTYHRDPFVKVAKRVGVDVKAILDEVAPVEKPKKEKPAKEAKAKPAKPKKAKAVKGESAL